MQSILVTSDLSERSAPALARGVELAVAHDAKLVILTVVNNELPVGMFRALETGAETVLKEQVEAVRADRKLSYEVRVSSGDPLADIPEHMSAEATDLLVVGPHRRRVFLDQVRETTVEHIIRSSRVPVLMVTRHPDGGYRNVLAGTALSKVCTTLVGMIPKVAPDAAVTHFHAHAVSFAREARNEFDTWKAVYRLPASLPMPTFYEGTPQDAVDALMQGVAFDLLAIGGHTRADGGRYFTGRFTAGLIRTPPCDLLIAK